MRKDKGIFTEGILGKKIQRDWGAGEKNERTHPRSTAPLLAKSPAKGESLVGAVDSAAALLEGLVHTAPASSASAIT